MRVVAAVAMAALLAACHGNGPRPGHALRTFDGHIGGGVVGPRVGQVVYLYGPYVVNGSGRPITLKSIDVLNVPTGLTYVGARSYALTDKGSLSAWEPSSGRQWQPDLHLHPRRIAGTTLRAHQGMPHGRYILLRYKVTSPGSFNSAGPALVRYEINGTEYEQKLPVDIEVEHARR
jgi:hypothetical protein